MGRAGKDVVWVPTFDAVVLAMLSMAQVTPEDLVFDLGAGDGKIAITAAKSFGARAVGIEYDPDMAKRAACLVQVEGVADKVRIVQGDIFKEDFSGVSVVTLYLLPHLNICVRHRLLAMEPGTRVVSHQFTMGEWDAEQSVQVQGRDVHRWTVPARVDGVWDFDDSQGKTFTVDLRQTFGTLSGEIDRAGAKAHWLPRRCGAASCASRSRGRGYPSSSRARCAATRLPACCPPARRRVRRSAGFGARCGPRPGPRCRTIAGAITAGSPASEAPPRLAL